MNSMKGIFVSISWFMAYLGGFAQPGFRTVVPKNPVTAGVSFQVQYVLEGGEKNAMIRSPDFPGCKLNSGPNIYYGNSGGNAICNFVYTLEVANRGSIRIPGAVVVSGNRTLTSEPVMIRVLGPEDQTSPLNKKGEPVSSEYLLRPGEDPYQKIRENLFVQVQLDKKHCLVGEPVLATFKLYSRLESKSDIIKNPGFYGFTVYDMAGLADHLLQAETVKGKLFDVHTIRQVQLYPLRPGRFTIDPMEIRNRVEFSRTTVNHKTEQQIAEGMMGIEEEASPEEGTEVFETTVNTASLTVEVSPIPQKSAPDGFTGALGQFSVSSHTASDQFSKNGQAVFEVAISGKGNFTQLDAPVVNWPAGIEGFDPRIEDQLDKTKIPLEGIRYFRYPFVCTDTGEFTIPPVGFTYYNKDSNRFVRVSTSPAKIRSVNETAGKMTIQDHEPGFEEKNEKAAKTGGLIAMLIGLAIIGYWIFRAKEKPVIAKTETLPTTGPSIADLLERLDLIPAGDERQFYTSLREVIWIFFATRFGLSGSELNKQALISILEKKTKDTAPGARLLQVLEYCETGIFTGVSMETNRAILVQQTREVMEKMSQES